MTKVIEGNFARPYIRIYLDGDIFDGSIQISGDDDLLAEHQDTILAALNNNPPYLTHLAVLSLAEDGWYLAVDEDGDLCSIDKPASENQAASNGYRH